MIEMSQYPCRNCVYFNECGENMRTMPCSGRMTKSQRKALKGTKANLIVVDEFPLKTREELIREGEREQARRAFYED